MGKPAFELRNSPSLMLSQRIACSTFALALLQGDYREGRSNWMQLEPRLAALKTHATPLGPFLKARAYRSAWHLHHRLQPANIEAMAEFATAPSFLGRLARIENVEGSELKREEYVPTLVMAALSLEWLRPKPKASIQVVKRERALQVLRLVLTRWKPARDCHINLPAFEFAGLLEYLREAYTQQGQSPKDVAAAVRNNRTNLAVHVFRPSPLVAMRFPATDPYRAVDYLLRLALDEKPLTDPALLRWGFDLVSAVLATEALFLCDAEHPDFGTFHRKRAEAVLGLAQLFFSEIAPSDIPRQIRAMDLLGLVDTNISQARRIAFATTFVVAWCQFRNTMKSWGIDFGWYRQLWNQSHGRLPAHGFTRLGRPPKYVVEAGRAWGVDRALNLPDVPTEENVACWDELVSRQIRQIYGSQVEALRTLDPPASAAAERVTDVILGLAGELRELGARFRPGYSMAPKDYDDLARELTKRQSRLRAVADRERKTLNSQRPTGKSLAGRLEKVADRLPSATRIERMRHRDRPP